MMLVDERRDREFLDTRCRQYDDNPAASEALVQAYYALYREIDPGWEPGKLHPLYLKGMHTFALPPELAPKSVVFKKLMPKSLSHYDKVYTPGYNSLGTLGGCYVPIVSKDWKNAIESVEPNVHEFHSIELKFKDAMARDHFMFRNRQCFDLVDLTDSHVDVFRTYEGDLRCSLKSKPHFVAAKRSIVLNRHWMQYLRGGSSPPFFNPFVSRELALKLHGLLPRKCSFFPVDLRD